MSLITTPAQKKIREDLCNACEHKKFLMGIAYCGQCNCGLSGKQIIASLQCPLKKWPILTIK